MVTGTEEKKQTTSAKRCNHLWDICTPDLYKKNPFRIVGLHADAGAKEIKRRIQEIRDGLEFGDVSEEFLYAYAPDPTPDLGEIQDASRIFDDPELRIAFEFFWFWPREWGTGRADPAIAAFMGGNLDGAVEQWKAWADDTDEDVRLVGRHNIAVNYHLSLLDQESKTAGRNLSEADFSALDVKWRESFPWWEELADSEALWSRVTARIRMLDDPRLTTGFSRRMRATFPEAFDRINALLAIRHIESNQFNRAEAHIEYMDLTHADLDDVPQTMAAVAEPLRKSIRNAIEKVEKSTGGKSRVAVQEISDMINSTKRPWKILKRLAPKVPDAQEDIGDFSDRISEICRTAAIAYGNQDKDWDASIRLVNLALEFARSKAQKDRASEDLKTVVKLKQQDHPNARQIDALIKQIDGESNYIKRISLLNQSVAPLLESLGQTAGWSSEPYSHMRDQIGFALRECGIGLFNLNIKEMNEGFNLAMQMQKLGRAGADYIPVGRCAMVWLSTELMLAVDALAVGDLLKGKLKEDHEALDGTRETINSLVNRNVLSLESKKGEWRVEGALPLPWAGIVKKGMPQPPPKAATPPSRPQPPPAPSTSNSSSGGCFIATAIYGSYEHPQVMVLREYRDRVLLPRPMGRAFVRLYYAYGPMFAPRVARSRIWRPIFQALLDRIVRIITSKGAKP